MQRLTDPSTAKKDPAGYRGRRIRVHLSLELTSYAFRGLRCEKVALRGSPVRVLIVMAGLIRLGGLAVFA